jgi:outer membrane protein
MAIKVEVLAVALALLFAAGAASAQDNIVKFGVTEYTTHTQTNGISGVGVPPGANADTGNATTVIFTYERLLTPNFGIELALGIPPRLQANATGSVAFLGDDVLSAKIVAPTVFLNYHFGAPGDTWRPYVGAGINYTRFVSIQSKLSSTAEMSDSWGWAVQGGMEYVLNEQWSLFGSVSALKVKSDLVASGATVLQTTIDFRPVVYTIGAAYKF